MNKSLIRVAYWVLSSFFTLSLLVCVAQAASVLTTDGQTFTGKILEEEDDHLLVELEGGVQVRIDRPQIQYIQRSNETEAIFKYNSDYLLLGVSFFYPAGVNLVAGYYFGGVGAKVAGGYWGSNAWGVQLNLSKKVSENRDILHNVSMVLGAKSPVPNLDHSYAGLGYDINARGFALEADLVNGRTSEGDFTPVLLFQLGYIHRFN